MYRPSFSRSFPLLYGGREKAFLKRAFFSAPNDFSISGKRFFVLRQMIFRFQPVGFPFSSWRKTERWVSHPSVVLYVGTQCFIVQPERWNHFSENSWGRECRGWGYVLLTLAGQKCRFIFRPHGICQEEAIRKKRSLPRGGGRLWNQKASMMALMIVISGHQSFSPISIFILLFLIFIWHPE